MEQAANDAAKQSTKSTSTATASFFLEEDEDSFLDDDLICLSF